MLWFLAQEDMAGERTPPGRTEEETRPGAAGREK